MAIPNSPERGRSPWTSLPINRDGVNLPIRFQLLLIPPILLIGVLTVILIFKMPLPRKLSAGMTVIGAIFVALRANRYLAHMLLSSDSRLEVSAEGLRCPTKLLDRGRNGFIPVSAIESLRIESDPPTPEVESPSESLVITLRSPFFELIFSDEALPKGASRTAESISASLGLELEHRTQSGADSLVRQGCLAPMVYLILILAAAWTVLDAREDDGAVGESATIETHAPGR